MIPPFRNCTSFLQSAHCRQTKLMQLHHLLSNLKRFPSFKRIYSYLWWYVAIYKRSIYKKNSFHQVLLSQKLNHQTLFHLWVSRICKLWILILYSLFLRKKNMKIEAGQKLFYFLFFVCRWKFFLQVVKR